MYVREGATDALMAAERKRFQEEEWPRIVATIERLGLDPKELFAAAEEPKENAG